MSNKSNRPVPIEQARAQAIEALGFLASRPIQVGEEVFWIPSLDLLDDEQQDRWDEMQFDMQKYDRGEDIELPAYTDKFGNKVEARTVPGSIKLPHQINGERVKPTYAVRVAQALFGEDYERFKKAGGRANDVLAIVMAMNKERGDREQAEAEAGADKSDAGDSDSQVASVSD